MLKHIVEIHEDEDPASIEFRMKAVKFHQSAFERQIFESVKIQLMRNNHTLLNSKSEFNRCALPRLGVKIGEKEFSKRKEEEYLEKKKEEEIEGKINELKKRRNKMRRVAPRDQPARKKRKMENGEQRSSFHDRTEVREKEDAEKRKRDS